MNNEQRLELLGAAHRAAMRVLENSGHTVEGVVLLAELDHEGVSIVCDDVDVNLSAVLAEASVRAAGAGV